MEKSIQTKISLRPDYGSITEFSPNNILNPSSTLNENTTSSQTTYMLPPFSPIRIPNQNFETTTPTDNIEKSISIQSIPDDDDNDDNINHELEKAKSFEPDDNNNIQNDINRLPLPRRQLRTNITTSVSSGEGSRNIDLETVEKLKEMGFRI